MCDCPDYRSKLRNPGTLPETNCWSGREMFLVDRDAQRAWATLLLGREQGVCLVTNTKADLVECSNDELSSTRGGNEPNNEDKKMAFLLPSGDWAKAIGPSWEQEQIGPCLAIELFQNNYWPNQYYYMTYVGAWNILCEKYLFFISFLPLLNS